MRKHYDSGFAPNIRGRAETGNAYQAPRRYDRDANKTRNFAHLNYGLALAGMAGNTAANSLIDTYGGGYYPETAEEMFISESGPLLGIGVPLAAGIVGSTKLGAKSPLPGLFSLLGLSPFLLKRAQQEGLL